MWAVVGLVAPLLLCALADATTASTAWDVLGRYSAHWSSTEAERPGRFVLRNLNTYSSHALCGAGGYVCGLAPDTRCPSITLTFGAALVLLGLLSFAWWASRRWVAQKYDNLLMETFVIALAAVVFSIAQPTLEPWLVAATLAFMLARGATFSGEAALLPCVALLLACVLYATVSLGGCGQYERLAAGVGVALSGVVCKVADAMGDGCPWGTAAFHYLVSAGFVLIFLWAQTLPVTMQ